MKNRNEQEKKKTVFLLMGRIPNSQPTPFPPSTSPIRACDTGWWNPPVSLGLDSARACASRCRGLSHCQPRLRVDVGPTYQTLVSLPAALTEDVIADLARFRRLGVLARHTSFALGRDPDPAARLRQLGDAYTRLNGQATRHR